jgi:hypothetical protein
VTRLLAAIALRLRARRYRRAVRDLTDREHIAWAKGLLI